MVVSAELLMPGRPLVVLVWSVIKLVFFSRVCSGLTVLSVRVCQPDEQTPLCITTRCHTEGRGRRRVRVCVHTARRLTCWQQLLHPVTSFSSRSWRGEKIKKWGTRDWLFSPPKNNKLSVILCSPILITFFTCCIFASRLFVWCCVCTAC